MRTVFAPVLVAAAFSSTVAMAQETPANPPDPKPNTIDTYTVKSNDKGLLNYWTPERLRQAKPMPLRQVDPKTFK